MYLCKVYTSTIYVTMCMFFAFCRSSSLPNAGSYACYCQNSCWSCIRPMTLFKSVHWATSCWISISTWTIQKIPKASQDDRVPNLSSSMAQRTTSRATWQETEKQFHGSTPLQGLQLPLHPICHEHLPGSAAKSLLWPSGGRASKHQIKTTYPPTSYMFLGCLTGCQNKVVIKYDV